MNIKSREKERDKTIEDQKEKKEIDEEGQRERDV